MPAAPLTDAALIADPANYLYAFGEGEALFVPMDRAAYLRSIFLDRRINAAAEGVLRRPLAALFAALGDGERPQPAWIFHMAHCGSTLLARALDGDDAALVLREPLGLRQLGVAAAHGDGGLADALRLATSLYGRRLGTDGVPTLVKANVPVNFLLRELLASGTPALLLYHPLAAWLTAVLGSEANRNWVRFVTDELAPGIERWAGPLAGLDETQRAAALWLAQARMFASALAANPHVRSLAADTLYAQPAPTLAEAARLFGRDDDPAAIAATVAGPVFSSYSKNPDIAFDAAARAAQRAATATALAGEIAAARRWVAGRAREFPGPDRLPAALTGEAPPLLG